MAVPRVFYVLNLPLRDNPFTRFGLFTEPALGLSKLSWTSSSDLFSCSWFISYLLLASQYSMTSFKILAAHSKGTNHFL